MASHCRTTMSIHMWSTDCRANRQPSDGRCSNILNTAKHSYQAAMCRRLCYSGLGRSPVNTWQMGYASLLLRKCLWWFFSNGCNAFNCEHPQICFGCTHLIYITLDQIKDNSFSQSALFMKIPILIPVIFLFHLVFLHAKYSGMK
jgi:hypothetical protein